MSDYTLHVHLDTDPESAEERIREALGDEGFGILTEIDLAGTLKAKIDVEMPPYVILGACNPPLAHKAVQADDDIGALLPCNVVVRANPDGGTDIVAADPRAMLGVAPASDALQAVADDARDRLNRALASVADAG